MLFYSTILIVSLIVAVVILWFYHTTKDTSKAIYKTIKPPAVDHSPTNPLKETTPPMAVTDTPAPWGTKSHQTPRNLAQTYAAKPLEQAPWGWPGHKPQQVREQHTHNARHSSLNDAPSADPASIRSQNVGWPYREDVMKTGGKVYKITRKVPPPEKTSLKNLLKPWGW
jgi:hypothetical protein